MATWDVATVADELLKCEDERRDRRHRQEGQMRSPRAGVTESHREGRLARDGVTGDVAQVVGHQNRAGVAAYGDGRDDEIGTSSPGPIQEARLLPSVSANT